MRAVKMRNGGLRNAVDKPNNNNNSSNGEAADGESREPHRFPAASPPSLGGTMVPDSKNTTMPPAQQRNPYLTLNTTATATAGGNSGTYSVDDNQMPQPHQQHLHHHTGRGHGNAERGAHEDGESGARSFDPLADALAYDAPLTFTARDDPRVVARLPLRFCEILPTIDQQLLYRQRQSTHQFSVDALPHAQSAAPPASPLHGVPASDAYPPVSTFLRDLLPRAVGRVTGCKTKMIHPSSEEQRTTQGRADGGASTGAGSGINTKSKSDNNSTNKDGSHAATATASSDSLTVMDEQRLFRDRVAERVLDYLLNPAATHQRNHGSNQGEQEEEEEVLADEQRYAVVESCLSGLREVPSDSVEYGAILRRLNQINETGAAATHPHNANDVEAEVDLPAYVQQLMVGAASELRDDDSFDGSAQDGTPFTASADPRAPVVASTLRATLDAILPPRMLVYYIVNYEAAVQVQQQRRAAQEQQSTFRAALQEHPDDPQSRAALAAVTALLDTQYAQAPVGVVLVLLERTSDVQAPRDYLGALEQSLDEVLERCHARCCGRPLQLSTSAQNAQQQQQQKQQRNPQLTTTTTTTTNSTALLAPTRPADTKKKGERQAGKSRITPATTTTILSTVKDPVCTRTTRPPPARPAATSATGGGSASVAATLHVTELNKERRLVQFDLLGEELLRQVAVDLPERGVLLRRVLDEAQLSLDARAIVTRERTRATQEHLLDGQDARESLAATHKQLEREAAELRERRAALQTRRAGLVAWAEAQQARATAERQTRLVFEERLRERLTAHTEAMKAAQEAARQSALA